jgi:Holliday junction resolvase RusA-like endonuclease
MGLPIKLSDLLSSPGVDQRRLGRAVSRSLDLERVSVPPPPQDPPQPAPARQARKRASKRPPKPGTPPKPTTWAAYGMLDVGREYAPGTEIATFRVPYRPVPWSVPNVRGRRTVKNAPLAKWQTRVATAARLAMDGRGPYHGHVKILLKFALVPATNGSEPDWTNLAKGAEDAIQGIVIGNDRKVVRAYTEKWESDRNYAVIKVVASERLIEGGHDAGSEHAGPAGDVP